VFDPLTMLMVGAGALVFREMNRKDYGELTPSRDERYRNIMEYCYQPELLFEEARLFNEYGLKTQAAMLKRRGEWRARPAHVKRAHEEVFQKALQSANIPAILRVAVGFEGWTATKKAATLRERARALQETMLQEAAQKAAKTSKNKDNGSIVDDDDIPQNKPFDPFIGSEDNATFEDDT
jgi:hypothetical protein